MKKSCAPLPNKAPSGAQPCPTEAPSLAPVVVEEIDLRNPLSLYYAELQNAIKTKRDESAVGHFVWSTPKVAGEFRPVSREGVGKVIEQATTWLRSKDVPAEALGVCEYYNKRPDVLHAHMCFITASPHTLWGVLANFCKGKLKISGRWMIALPGAGPTPENDLLHYLLVPTATKWRLDMRPQKTIGFSIPRDIIDARRKAYRRLTEVAASPDDVFTQIWAMPSISSLHDFQVLVDERSEIGRELDMEDLSSLPFRRLGKFLSSNARAAQIVQQSIDRRDLAAHHAGLRKSFQNWLDEAAASRCACIQDNLFYRQLKSTQEWQDSNTYPKNQVRTQMRTWLKGVATKSFTGREQNLYFKGPPGCGKSTFCQAVLNLLPQFFVGSPCWDSSTPWSGLRKWQLILDASEFQPTSSLNASQVLVLLERKEKGINVNVKGQVHFALKGSEIPFALISSNKLEPVSGWKQEQFDALEQRCLMVSLSHKMPDDEKILVPGGSAVHATCRGCSGKFCMRMMAEDGADSGPESEAVTQGGKSEREKKQRTKEAGRNSQKSGMVKKEPSSTATTEEHRGGKTGSANAMRGGHAMQKTGKGRQDGGNPEDGAVRALKKKLVGGQVPPPSKMARISSLDDPFGDDVPSPGEFVDAESESIMRAMAEIDEFLPDYTAAP